MKSYSWKGWCAGWKGRVLLKGETLTLVRMANNGRTGHQLQWYTDVHTGTYWYTLVQPCRHWYISIHYDTLVHTGTLVTIHWIGKLRQLFDVYPPVQRGSVVINDDASTLPLSWLHFHDQSWSWGSWHEHDHHPHHHYWCHPHRTTILLIIMLVRMHAGHIMLALFTLLIMIITLNGAENV